MVLELMLLSGSDCCSVHPSWMRCSGTDLVMRTLVWWCWYCSDWTDHRTPIWWSSRHWSLERSRCRSYPDLWRDTNNDRLFTRVYDLHLIRLLVNQERTLISALVWLSLMALDLPLIILFLCVAVVVVIEVLVFLFYIQIIVQSRCICSFTCNIFFTGCHFSQGVTLFPHFLLSILKFSRLKMFLAFYDSILLNSAILLLASKTKTN